MSASNQWKRWQSQLFPQRPLPRFLAIILFVFAATSTSFAANDFQSQLRHLKGGNAAVVGREKLIEEGEKLIADYPNDPRTAEAMFHIATLLENANPTTGMTPDRPAALIWYRKAVERAEPGSKISVNARKYLAARVDAAGPDGRVEAKKLREDALRESHGDWRVQVDLEHELMSRALREQNPAEGEVHYQKMVDLLKNPPKEAMPQKEIDFMISANGDAIVQAWPGAALTKDDRARRIHEFVAAHPGVPELPEAADRALQALEKRVDSPVLTARIPIEPKGNGLRWTFVAVNVVVILTLVVVLMKRRRKKLLLGSG